jgi:uncharacterized membrane protein YagU involved in acid resistance
LFGIADGNGSCWGRFGATSGRQFWRFALVSVAFVFLAFSFVFLACAVVVSAFVAVVEFWRFALVATVVEFWRFALIATLVVVKPLVRFDHAAKLWRSAPRNIWRSDVFVQNKRFERGGR